MVNSKKAYTYFKNEFGLKRSTNGWYSSYCPLCDKEGKRYSSFHYGVSKCYTCSSDDGKVTGVINVIMKYTNLGYVKAKELLEKYEESDLDFNTIVELKGQVLGTIDLPIGYRPILQGDNTLAKRARQYLVNRGISLEYADSVGIGYVDIKNEEYTANFFGYLIIPFKRGGILYYYQTRAFLGQDLRYKNPNVSHLGIGKSEIIFNQDAFSIHKGVFIFEGIFCSMTVGEDATAILGKSLSTYQKEIIIKSPCKEVYIGMDEGCLDEAKAIAMDLIDYKKVKVLDFVGGDPNELGKEHVLDLCAKTPYSELFDLLV